MTLYHESPKKSTEIPRIPKIQWKSRNNPINPKIILKIPKIHKRSQKSQGNPEKSNNDPKNPKHNPKIPNNFKVRITWKIPRIPKIRLDKCKKSQESEKN